MKIDFLKSQDEQIYCACTGQKCGGECREQNLYRKRKVLKRCPAAYEKEKKNEHREI